ncbi:hypothetical protein [Terrisporobacter mayombei]|uniref:Uncharacterized protein n=1 Tax=Terrisporobacter mayombei TaxID=1541 RepID=A0ABY9Q534_9FIRM|nr:hypothetical protein [Terrisporobacter mayombei]MCC3869319.1 hypothetical protein [Terrisporobacter mayombei]WMT82150.1 hypothetical protein TEMA_25080 [Terrisporobacter mayombei]
MLHTSLDYILVRSFPECAIMLLVGCYFLNLKISIGTLCKKTLMLGIIQSFIRMLPISFGIHTIIGMALVLFILVDVSKDSFMNCIIALCKLFLCLILSEFIYISLLTNVFNVSRNALVNNYTIRGAFYTLPSLIILVLLAFVIEFIIKKLQEGSIVKHNE